MISLARLTKRYETPAGVFAALRDVDLQIASGEYIAITGKSGSGKSTLLNMLGGIDRPSSGTVTVAGSSIGDMSEDRLAGWRGRTLGFVFQFFQLLPTLTAAENVMLPMDFVRSRPPRDRRPAALALLDRMDVADQADKLPAALSGGQQQRVAIARALANDPPIVLADEPTGNLDSHTSAEIFQLFADLAAAGKTVVVVTHERELAGRVNRVIQLTDGAVSQ
jgi:putative ABC transport system ATP-binding protein